MDTDKIAQEVLQRPLTDTEKRSLLAADLRDRGEKVKDIAASLRVSSCRAGQLAAEGVALRQRVHDASTTLEKGLTADDSPEALYPFLEVRARNRLDWWVYLRNREGRTANIGDLCNLMAKDLLKQKNLGHVSVAEISRTLARFDMSLKPEKNVAQCCDRHMHFGVKMGGVSLRVCREHFDILAALVHEVEGNDER